MSSDTTVQASDQQQQDEYVQTMINNFNEAQADLVTMQESSDDMIAEEEDQTHHKQGNKKWNADQEQIDADQATYDAAETDLLSLDPGMYSFCQTQDAFLDSASQVQDQNTKKKDQRSDLDTIQSDMDDNYAAGDLQLQADMYTLAIAGDTDGQLTPEQEQKCAQNSINLTAQSQTQLNLLQDTMTTQIQDYSDEENSAEEKKSQHSYATAGVMGPVEVMLVWGQKSSAQKTINNDDFMIEAMGNALADLGKQMAQASPQMLMLNDTMQLVLRQTLSISKNDNLSMSEKQNAILQLMMVALGVFNQVKAQTEADKEKNTEKMSDANVTATNMNMAQTKAQNIIQANMERHEKIMSIEMRVMECTMMAVMTALAPGYGTAAMILMMGALQQSGLLDMATEKLGAAMGSKVGAEALVAGLEIGLTLGAGAADIVAEKAASEAGEIAVDEAMNAATEYMNEQAAAIGEKVAGKAAGETVTQAAEETAGEEAAARAGKTTATKIAEQEAAERTEEEIASKSAGTLVTEVAAQEAETEVKAAATEEAKQQLEKVGRKAAEKAAKSMTEEFLRQPAGTLTQMIAEGTFKESLQRAVTEAATNAAKVAIEDASTFLVEESEMAIPALEEGAGTSLQTALEDEGAEGIQYSLRTLTEDEIENISGTAARDSVVDQVSADTGKTRKDVSEKIAKRESGMLAKQQVGVVTAMSISNTNLLVDSMKASMDKAMGETDGKWAQRMLITAKVLELLVEMFGMLFLAGAPSSIFETSPTTWIKVANAVTIVGDLANADAQLGMGSAQLKQAKAQENLAIESITSQQIQMNQDQIMRMSQMSQQQFSEDLRQSIQMQYEISGHLMDSELEAIKILSHAV